MSEGDDYLGAVRSPRSSVARRHRRLALHVAFTLVLSLIALGTPASAVDTTCSQVATYDELTAALSGGCTDITLANPVSISGEVTIAGTGEKAENTTITAPPNSPALIIAAATGVTTDVTITNLAITGADDRKASGGAIGVEAGTSLTLDRVSIHGNYAGEGAGVYNAGTTHILNSVFYDNTADDKGGAVNNDGTLHVENSTFAKNKAQQGGAVSTAGLATFNFVTIVSNTSKNKIGAGTHLTGGTIELDNSIVANNYSGNSFYDCSGQTDVNHVVFSSTQGCQPSGVEGTDYKVVGQIIFPAQEDPQDNGGPTRTLALIDQDTTTEAFDHPAYQYGDPSVVSEVTGSPVTLDQRGVGRPEQPSVGAYEPGVTVDAALTTSKDPVPVGAVSAPLADITLAIQQAASAGTSVAGTPLSAIPLSAITIGDAPLSAIPLSAISPSAIPLSAIPLSAITAHSTDVGGTPLSAIPLSAIPLSAIPLSAIDSVLLSDLSRTDGGTLSDFLVGSPFEDWPLLSLTFGDLTGLPLTSDYVTNNSTIASIPLSAIPLSAIGDVTDTDCSTTDCDTTTLGEITPLPDAELGDVIGLDDINLESTPLSAIPLSAIALGTLPLSAIPLSAIDVNDAEATLSDWCSYLGPTVCDDLGIDPSSGSDGGATLISVAIAGVPLSAIPLSAIPLSAIPLSAIPLSAIPLSAINWQSTPLSAIPLSAIPLSAICADEQQCSDATDPTLGDIPSLGGFAADASIALLDSVVDSFDYVLWDLLFGLFGPQDIPWALADDLNAIRLPAAENDPSLSWNYILDFQVDGPGSTASVDLDLPLGFIPVDGHASLTDSTGGVTDATGTETQLQSPTNTPISLHFDLGTLPAGSYTMTIPVWAGVELGSFTATAQVSADAGFSSASASDTATVQVVESGVTNRTVTANNMEIAHVASVGDAQVFKLQVPSGIQGASVKLLLSNLTTDLDLVLFGPKESDYLRGTPLPGFGTIEDHKYDLNPDDDVLDADVLRDVNTDFSRYGISTLPEMVPIAVSAKRGTANEEIEARIPTDGPYYAVVSGYNGASSNSAFALQGRFLGNTIACTPLSGTWRDSWPLGTAPSLPTAPDGLNTLILYNSGRFADNDPLLTYLQDFEANPDKLGAGVVAMAVPVDAYPNVGGALGVWYSSSGQCDPEAANNVVRAIGTSIIDNYPDIANIVIVGDDSQVPFARLVDRANVSNEASFGATLPTGASPELRSALARGYYFSDDPYGSKPGIAFADGEYFVPSIPVGRLVETSDQILAQFQEFTSTGGVLAGKTAAVTGYDFLTDGAQAVSSELQQLDPSQSNVSTSINETWTSGDLITLLENDYSVGSVNAHFDQYRLLPAAGNSNHTESDLFKVADLPTVSGSQSNIFDFGALLFSMGCHSGLSVTNIQMTTVPGWAKDWAEALTGLGAAWVANSGYGYGDSQVVAYSETISADFAGYLDSTSAGQAWVRAKQQFASGLLSVSPYHTKAMNEFVFFGLPMLKTETAAAAPAPTLPDAGTGPAIGSDPTGVGLQVAHVESSTGLTPHDGYYSGNGGTLEIRGRAVTALGELDVTRPDGSGGLADQALGVVITGLSSTEEDPFLPLFFNPVSGPSSTTDRPHVLDSTFPAGLAHLTSYVGDDGQIRQKIVFAATRFRSDPTDGSTGTLVKYGHFTADVYYGQVGNDTTAPLIEQAEGVSDGNIAYFQVEVTGDQHSDLTPTDDTRRVNVLFAPSSGGSLDWQTVELVRVPGTNRWVGGTPITDSDWNTTSFSFWVQACDAYANCGASTFKGLDYLTADSAATGVHLSITSGVAGSNGWYRSSVTIAADVTNSALSLDPSTQLKGYVLDGGGLVPLSGTSDSIDIPTEGTHYLIVHDTAGNVGTMLIAIDETPPSIVITTPAEGASFGQDDEVTADFSCSDLRSGVAGCTGSFPNGSLIATSILGDYQFEVIATDFAGNQTTLTHDYTVADTTPPVVTITIPGDGDFYELNQAVDPVFECSDNSDPNPSCAATTGVTTDGKLLTDTIGSHTFAVVSTDASGNSATESVTFTVGYRICLLYDPTKPQPATGAVAIKLQICDGSGNNLSKSSIKVTAETLYDGAGDDSGLVPQDSGQSNSSPTFEFRYDAKLKGYIYNLNQELPPGSYVLTFTVVGTGDHEYEAPFVLK